MRCMQKWDTINLSRDIQINDHVVLRRRFLEGVLSAFQFERVALFRWTLLGESWIELLRCRIRFRVSGVFGRHHLRARRCSARCAGRQQPGNA